MIPILIPSYQPTESLVRLVEELKKVINTLVIVIDDGSDAKYQSLFDQLKTLKIEVIHHGMNLGKGAALKTGIKHIISTYSAVTSIVTCDSDFQHHPDDIKKIFDYAEKNPTHVVLGTRDFSLPHVPFKSRYGNKISSFYFYLTTGKKIPDTQTGLRALPKSTFEIALSLEENRFDYEMKYLMLCAKTSITLTQIPIQTLYENNNASSHFKPVRDAYKIYRQPITFVFVGLSSAVIDIGIFSILMVMINFQLASTIFIATLVARIVSGIYNFLMNKWVSFQSKTKGKREFVSYLLLYVFQLGASASLVYVISFQFEQLTYVKLIVDSILFMLSYYIQKHYIFIKN
jgi:glycosyltransferase involved in cell wall biosynthesis